MHITLTLTVVYFLLSQPQNPSSEKRSMAEKKIFDKQKENGESPLQN